MITSFFCICIIITGLSLPTAPEIPQELLEVLPDWGNGLLQAKRKLGQPCQLLFFLVLIKDGHIVLIDR